MRLRLAKKIVKFGPGLLSGGPYYSWTKWTAALVRCGWVRHQFRLEIEVKS